MRILYVLVFTYCLLNICILDFKARKKKPFEIVLSKTSNECFNTAVRSPHFLCSTKTYEANLLVLMLQNPQEGL